MQRGKREVTKTKAEYSKKLVTDIRSLLWVVTVGGLLLAFYCVRKNYLGALPWVTSMVGLPWTAHGVICSFYLNMAKSDHKVGGITFETAKANNCVVNQASNDSPKI